MEQQDRRDMNMREMQQQQQQQQDDQRGRKQPQQQQPQPPPQQPQKCPRCDSLNTKFCYYNNYSLSQPRYFCKTCRRYWTQGGTLRNVPVGGGCRKGKRLKRSSSSLSPDHTINLNSSATSRSKTVDSLPLSIAPPLVPIASQMNLNLHQQQHHQQPLFYPGGGFLSSLAAFQTFNQHQQQQQNQIPPSAAEFGSPGLSLLQGFNFQQMHHFQQQQNLYHQTHDLSIGGTSSDGVEEKVIPSTSHQEWSSQGFNIPNSGEGYWTNPAPMSTTSTVTEPIPLMNTPHWTDHLGSYGGGGGGGPPQPPPSSSTTTHTHTPTSSSPPSFL